MQDDTIIAFDGTHHLYGGYGDDLLISEAKTTMTGLDTMHGGAGTDTFVVGHNPNPLEGEQAYIQDLSPGEIILPKAGGLLTTVGTSCHYINYITYEQV